MSDIACPARDRILVEINDENPILRAIRYVICGYFLLRPSRDADDTEFFSFYQDFVPDGTTVNVILIRFLSVWHLPAVSFLFPSQYFRKRC